MARGRLLTIQPTALIRRPVLCRGPGARESGRTCLLLPGPPCPGPLNCGARLPSYTPCPIDLCFKYCPPPPPPGALTAASQRRGIGFGFNHVRSGCTVRRSGMSPLWQQPSAIVSCKQRPSRGRVVHPHSDGIGCWRCVPTGIVAASNGGKACAENCVEAATPCGAGLPCAAGDGWAVLLSTPTYGRWWWVGGGGGNHGKNRNTVFAFTYFSPTTRSVASHRCPSSCTHAHTRVRKRRQTIRHPQKQTPFARPRWTSVQWLEAPQQKTAPNQPKTSPCGWRHTAIALAVRDCVRLDWSRSPHGLGRRRIAAHPQPSRLPEHRA